MNHLAHHIALAGVYFRPDRPGAQSGGFGMGDVLPRNGEHDVVTASLQRTAKADIRIQVTE
jgi:hypothetical protein